MPEQSSTDMLMQFVLNGQPVSAESALSINKHDPFMEGFHEAGYQDYSDYFEVLDFDLSMRLKPQENKENPKLGAHGPGNHGGHVPHAGHGDRLSPESPVAQEQLGEEFESWRAASEREYTSIVYPFEFQQCSFERLIDAATPTFFDACSKCKTFDKAVLVKRTALPGGRADFLLGRPATPQIGYLRFTFHQVLITSLTWDDGDVVKEKCNFICKGASIHYRQNISPDRMVARHEFYWNQGDSRMLTRLRRTD